MRIRTFTNHGLTNEKFKVGNFDHLLVGEDLAVVVDLCFLVCLLVVCGEYYSSLYLLSDDPLFHPTNTRILEFQPTGEWQLSLLIDKCRE